LRRFNDSYSRNRQEDKIVDYWIALENLFTNRDERAEITFRVCLRGARFIGSDQNERSRVRNRLRESYKVRSKIVHGDSVASERLEVIEVSTSELLRGALRSWIAMGGTTASAIDLEMLS